MQKFIIIYIIILFFILYFIYTKFFYIEHFFSNNSLKYYGKPCQYIKNDSFYDVLHENNFQITNNINEASLIVPCSYENTEDEIKFISTILKKNNIPIFMLDNTDQMASKLLLWEHIVKNYGVNIASKYMPYTYSLIDNNDLELFKKIYDKNKLYITKNNEQRQEGIQIHDSLNSIILNKDKFILIQELLQDPYLINGRKINLRLYCLLIKHNNNAKILIYNNGFMYYTPELFAKNNPSFKKNITTGYIDRSVYLVNPLTHHDFKSFLDNNPNPNDLEKYLKANNIIISNFVFNQIYILLKDVIKCFVDVIGINNPGLGFQLYGADIAINDKLQPMLMEINKGPDLTAKDERDKHLKKNLSIDILKSIGLLNNINNNFIKVYERININNVLYEL
jgi:hypothetical protein